MDLPKRQETIVLGCARRGDSFPVCPQKAEHRLNKLQRQLRAVAISSDTRDGHETLTLLLQSPRILCASTGHYQQTNHPKSLCSPPLTGSCDPGTNSTGEHTACLRLFQCHTGLCCWGLPCIPITTTIPLPPPGLNEQKCPNQLLL